MLHNTTIYRFLFITLVLFYTSSLWGEGCENLLELQEGYMDVHESDYRQASAVWNSSLYAPLQRNMRRLLELTEASDLHFVYVAPGPRAPLFDDETFRDLAKQKIRRITLIDISSRILKESESKLRKMFSDIEIDTFELDLTDGLAHSYARSLHDGNESWKMKLPMSAVPSLNADIVYSEMMATFTGVAALLEKEKRDGPISDELLRDWQQFNEASVQRQAAFIARSLLKPKGQLVIATDVKKIFDDQNQETIDAFDLNGFPVLDQYQQQLGPWDSKEIFWRDELTNENGELKSRYSHYHLVEFRVYARLP